MAPRLGGASVDAATSSPSESEEEELGSSRSYLLSKEHSAAAPAGKRSSARRKISDIDLVDEQVLRSSLCEIVPKHEEEIESLIGSYKNMYSKWLFDLRCGFNLLIYGFGSKRALLEDFASTMLLDYSVVVVNGYLPSVNLKQVIEAIAELLSSQIKANRKRSSAGTKEIQSFSTHSFEDLFSFISQFSEDNGDFMCILLHNIDGPALRNTESQQYLARISECSHIRIIASIDHVNAPLMWNKKMVHTQFKWSWCHVPTFAPYKVEGTFFPLILASGGNAQTTKTALIVLQSLTPNAQSVFRVLAEYQLANQKEQGMPVNMLYTKCRERFLVSSQVTLNSHLREFKDHELVKTRRHCEGQDCLYIPLPTDALEKLLQELA